MDLKYNYTETAEHSEHSMFLISLYDKIQFSIYAQGFYFVSIRFSYILVGIQEQRVQGLPPT